MSLIHAIILGVIEGVTEFLPISSTAHLIIAGRLLNLPQTDFQKLFIVFIQGGAILGVLIIYFKYIFRNQQLLSKILFSFLPTALISFFLYKTIKNVFFDSSWLIAIAFGLIGGLFVLIEFFILNKQLKLKKLINQLSYKGAIIIGITQALAVVPGVSRAGIVLITMMLMGYKRDESAVYSFLLAVPTILAAAFFDLYKTQGIVFSDIHNLYLLILGFGFSFIFAYLSIKWLIGYLQKKSLVLFGIYRMIFAFLLLMI